MWIKRVMTLAMIAVIMMGADSPGCEGKPKNDVTIETTSTGPYTYKVFPSQTKPTAVAGGKHTQKGVYAVGTRIRVEVTATGRKVNQHVSCAITGGGKTVEHVAHKSVVCELTIKKP